MSDSKAHCFPLQVKAKAFKDSLAIAIGGYAMPGRECHGEMPACNLASGWEHRPTAELAHPCNSHTCKSTSNHCRRGQRGDPQGWLCFRRIGLQGHRSK